MRRFGLIIPACLCLLLPASDASEFRNLARQLPPGANAVIAIDVGAALDTDLAKENGWGDPDKSAGAPIYLPPEADKVIVSALVDPPNQFQQAWTAAVIGLTESLPMKLIARAEGGYTDTIGETEAAWVPSNAYFLNFGEDLLGLMYPSNRQLAARWIKGREENETGLSGYLTTAVTAVELQPQIVLALDTADTMASHRLHQALSESPVLEKFELDFDETFNLFLSLKGVNLEITISDKVRGRFQVKFGQDVTFEADAAKDFVMNALTNMQAEIPGIEDWNFSVSGDSIYALGDINESGLRRMLSLLEIPTTKFSSLKDEDTENEADADTMAEKTYVYFQSIQKLIEDLERNSKSRNGDSYWFDKYAKKIEKLPILHVDPDLLDFGQMTAETLRVMSGARKEANLQTGVARMNIEASGSGLGSGDYNVAYRGYRHGYRGGGYYAYRPSSRTQGARNKQKSVNAANQRNQKVATSKKLEGFRLINNATADMRRTLTERYDREF